VPTVQIKVPTLISIFMIIPLLFDLNDKHSFRANIIGINNDLNYAEYANEDQNESKVSQLSQKNLGYGGWTQWTNAFRTEIVTYFPDITLTPPIIAYQQTSY
jgi:hypothetical protein